MDQFERHKSTASVPSRSFLSRTLTKRDISSESSEKGPLGLNTLYEPFQSAIADLVFVHGLGGGSQSTWTKSLEPSLFWPQEWLPQDAGFEDTRIHSFGYNANWNKESTLNIHDFAKSLLGSIQDCPAIPRDSDVPLALVGHSMGGLVIKKAYVIARQSQEFKELARRVCTIVFLATPHRGADLAQLLTKILCMSSGPRPFVTDLHRNSLATQSINDEFPQYCQDLQLFSFYETLATNYGIGKSVIVEKDMAVLGYPNERTAYLNANHRDICKYATPNDPNYLTIRNALASIIDGFRSRTVSSKRVLDNEQRRLLDDFLGISDAPEDDLMAVDAIRMRGSCEWLMKKDGFLHWRDTTTSQLYWINAKPATGKSVLSGYVIHHLRDLNRDCMFYFFRYGDTAKSTISAFLRSMAWQMALVHPEIFDLVLEIHNRDHLLIKTDYRTVWRKLFLDVILKVKFERPQYWVVDALDECKTDHELVRLLLKVEEMCRVRILVTSRNCLDSYRQMIHPEIKIIQEEILADDTRSDISLYLEANMNHLPSVDEQDRRNMVTKILRKSAGCFLWVSLVLHELRQVHTSAEIRQVLDDVPSDMDELYSRILDSMSRAPYGKLLAKGILTWAVCSARPLTTSELYHALQLDMKDTIDSIERSITTSCGQLVFIDAHSRVQMVHQTARDYLLRSNIESDFAVDKKSGHKRLALTCLQYLNGHEMKGPRHRKLSVSSIVKERSEFASYACNALSEHITHVSSTDDDILVSLARFLNSSNVLSWVEYISQNSDLNRLIHTGIALRDYLRRRSKHMSPFGKEVVLLDSWATDLVRIVTKFGQNLSTSPGSIFNIIPPFCPSETAPRKQFAASMRGLTVLGLSNTYWDDCLSTIAYQQEQVSALACTYDYFATGLSSGKIMIYDQMTCQESQTLLHDAPVKILQFGETGKILVSSSVKNVCTWDTTSWQQLWRFDLPQQCMSFALTDNDRLLLGALKNNHLLFWDLTIGVLRDLTDWTQDLEGDHAHAFRRPTVAAFGLGLSLLAVVYRGQDILLWDLERDALHETYSKDTGARPGTKINNATVWSLVFCSAPTATLLAASYSDGDLVLFDTSKGSVVEMTLANAQTLACSIDGRTLASGDSSGTIQLFDFETLKLLYRIRSEDFGIKQIAFSGDGQRLLDIRGSQCRVWDPMVLVRQEADDATSDTISVSTTPQEFLLELSAETVLITALACPKEGEMFFCGKDDGSVWSYEYKNGRQESKLINHAKGVSVVSLLFDDESRTLTSTDSSSRIMTYTLAHHRNTWKVDNGVLDRHVGVAVDQLLSNIGHTRMLISTANIDTLWSITPNGQNTIKAVSKKDPGPYRWQSHPLNHDLLILISGNVASIYSWETFQRLTDTEGILLEGSILPELSIRFIVPCFNGTVIATAFAEPLKKRSKSKLLLWDSTQFNAKSVTAVSIPHYQYLADQVEFLIGTYGQRLVFLHSSGWICSADPETFNLDCYVRHFFIPADWLSTDSDLIMSVSRNGDVIFVKRDEVAVIKRGLDTNEHGSYIAPGKRPSLTVPSFF